MKGEGQVAAEKAKTRSKAFLSLPNLPSTSKATCTSPCILPILPHELLDAFKANKLIIRIAMLH